MIFPFSDETHDNGGFVGQTYNIYLNEGDQVYEFYEEITFMAEGKTPQGWTWILSNGCLMVVDETGTPVFDFNGVHIVNGAVSLVGVQLPGGCRVVMREKNLMADGHWRVAISTCKGYMKSTLPVLLKSLRQAGMPKDRMTVVVGNVPHVEAFDVRKEDIHHISSDKNLRGFTALEVVVGADADYQVLLHDTCTVSEDFIARMDSIDVGLKPDIVLFRAPSEELEMGVYSQAFLDDQTELEGATQMGRLAHLVDRANVVIILGGNKQEQETTDPYSMGTPRTKTVLAKPGITKFKSVKPRGNG